MKIQRIENGDRERKIVRAMAHRRSVLGPVAVRWQKGSFSSDWADIVGSWCVDFWKKHGKVPGNALEGIAANWAESQGNQDRVELVGKFLSSVLSKPDDKTIPSSHLIDLAGRHFNEVAKRKFADKVQGAVDSGQWDKVDEYVRDLRRIELGAGAEVDVMQDAKAWERALNYSEKPPLIIHSGGLKRFFGHSLTPGSFVSFQAPEGTGKSFMLMDMAYRAATQRRKTLFVEIGDMTEDQVMRRFIQRAAGRPLSNKTVEWPVKINLLDKSWDIKREPRSFKNSLAITDAKKVFARIQKERIKSSRSFLKLKCFPTGMISVAGIKGIVEDLAFRDWVADAVILDYADLLAPPAGIKDGREKINATWEALRGLSTWGHLPLVVTATQTNRDSYKRQNITRHNVSEDKRKLAHVTGMIGINQTEEEKKMGGMRLNWNKLREDEFLEGRMCYVAGCLAVASPCVLSAMRSKKKEGEDGED